MKREQKKKLNMKRIRVIVRSSLILTNLKKPIRKLSVVIRPADRQKKRISLQIKQKGSSDKIWGIV